MPRRDLDVVLFGATGFVGRLTCRHLASRAPAGVRIGLAGRDEQRLNRLKEDLGDVAEGWPVLVADVDRPESLRRMAEQTRAVATTVGPYARYGLPLVDACATAGTHYADLTGEVSFVRAAIDAHHDRAVASGARIVVGAGFDAVPSDIGVLELHRAAVAANAGDLLETAMLVTEVRGGISGGTFASMTEQIEQMRSSADARRLLADPYALSPDRDAEPDRREPDWAPERDPMSVSRDPRTGRWRAPFVMASYNTRVVRRSNALQGHGYGRRFRYQEYVAVGGGVTGLAAAVGVAAGTGAFAAALMAGPTRSLITSRMPSPGEGPSERTRTRGRFRVEFWAGTASGTDVRAEFAAAGDPGYAATSVMFGESALALALDEDDLPDAAGVLTPASGIGSVLTSRLRLNDFTISAAAG